MGGDDLLSDGQTETASVVVRRSDVVSVEQMVDQCLGYAATIVFDGQNGSVRCLAC